MAQEIERKFLVRDDSWRQNAKGERYRQGYLSTHKARTVRVRRVGDKAFLTVKGLTVGATRAEYEYPIPTDDAEEMLERLCETPLIEKTRYKVEHAGKVWEIDEFLGVNQGLILAEIELPSETTPFEKPGWAGAEVTEDRRYYNSNLIAQPFSTW